MWTVEDEEEEEEGRISAFKPSVAVKSFYLYTLRDELEG